MTIPFFVFKEILINMGCGCNEKKYSISMGCCQPVLGPIENYYTKPQIDKMIEEIESAVTSGCCISPEEVDDKISSYTYSQEEIDEKIPSLSGYATEEWVEQQGYITGVDLSNYATLDDVDRGDKIVHNEVQEVDGKVQTVSGDVRTLSGSVNDVIETVDDIAEYIETVNSALTAHTADTSIHFTTGAVQTQINNSISNYYTTAQTINLIESAVTVVEGEIPSLDDYVTKEELPSDIASKQWVNNQNYVTNVEFLQYVTNLQDQINALKEQISGCCGDTGTTLTRWVTMTGASDYTCSGTTKMTKEEEEQSTDGGNTWTPTGNYRPGSTILEVNCLDCGYTPEPSNLKYKGDYNNGQSKYVECDGVPSITVWEVQNDVPSTIDNLSGATFYACCEYIANNILGGANNIERVEIKEGVISVGGGAFQTSSALTTVIIPNSVKYIDGTAFGDCPNLSALTIGSGVTEIGEGAFSGDSSISNDLNLPNVTKINTAAFQGCSSLHSVNIGSGVTRIQGSAFRGCSGLTSITVNADVPPSLGSMAFDGSTCNIFVPAASLETYKTTYGWSTYADRIQAIPAPPKWIATYSDSHTESAECSTSDTIVQNEITKTDLVSVEIKDCVSVIDYAAFYGYTSLTSIDIPDSVTTIERKSFPGCTSLTNITIPSGVTKINYGTFSGCTSLSSVTIPSVTSIGIEAFYGCTNLSSIVIPNVISYIETSAFTNCSGLTSVTVEATTPPSLVNNVFDNTNNCPIYVPSESVEAYKAASGWSTYASRIQAIP